MTLVLLILVIQGAMGALDTIWHHELEVALPSKPGARKELMLHAARSTLYGVVFLVLGSLRPGGLWAVALAALLMVEIFITLEDFLLEDRTRRLPPSERVLHTVMAVGYGVFLAVFAPILFAWAQLGNVLTVAPHGALGWICVAYGVGALVSGARDGVAALTLRAPILTAPERQSGRTVLVTGGTGFIGALLVERLIARADRVILLTRDHLAACARFGDAPMIVERLDHLPAEMRIDAVVNLAGALIAGGRWTRGRCHELMESRLATTRAVLALVERLERKPACLINASAVGFYGDRGDEILDETAGPRPGFMSALCRRWEEEAWLAEAAGLRVCRLRFGLVLDWSGGVLPMLALPARFGFAATLGSGKQWAPWIARHDALRLIERAIEDDRYDGPINAVAPDLVTQGEFTRRLSAAFGWPAWLKVPAAPVRLGLGEMSDLLLAGQKVVPARLKALGFRFERERLESVFSRHGRTRRTRPHRPGLTSSITSA
ncbi:MAG TPA: TIGR01777 family oxidoreductase [Caulobacteraceae bacterium]|jgi:hypothetical protein